MPSGLRCQSPALRGSAFCYHHGRRIQPRAKGQSTEHRVEMPASLDRNGISNALNSVVQALAGGCISAWRASILLQGLQMAANNPQPCVPSRTAPAPSQSFGKLLSAAGVPEGEAAALVNALAAKLGLASQSSPPQTSGPKSPAQ